MVKRALGKTGYEISPVVFGGIINTGETQADANRYVAYAAERGVNYFDVAPTYGDAEERLGEALLPYRKGIYLACKTTRRDAAGSREELEASLKTLRTDYFDNYQLHSIRTVADVEEAFAPGGIVETIEAAKKEGIIRRAGITVHSEENALRCLEMYDFDTVLFPMNWALGVLYGFGDRIAEVVKKKNIGLLCMKVFAHRMWRDGETRPDGRKWYKHIAYRETNGAATGGMCESTREGSNGAALALAAMKYALAKGADALVPPGDFAAFCHMLEHIDEAIAFPYTPDDAAFLLAEAQKIKGYELELAQ